MKAFGRLVLSLVVAVTFMAVNSARAGETWHKINAKAEGVFTGPTSTASQIIGGGILHGTTTADLTITGVLAPGVVSFEGTLVVTTHHGTLTLFVFNGVYDLVTGEFSSDSVVTGGTGRFDGAAGGLFFHGLTFPDGTFIDDEISGNIRVDLP